MLYLKSTTILLIAGSLATIKKETDKHIIKILDRLSLCEI